MTLLISKTCHPVSVFTKPSAVGLDQPVQAYQKFLYPQIMKGWGLTDDTVFDFYGRAYRNQTDDGYTPEIYAGKKDYQELFFDDKKTALAFFGVQDQQGYQRGGITAKVYLIFMVNLQELKGTDAQLLDEETRNTVLQICARPRLGFRMTGFCTGIDKVFREYSGWRKSTGIKYRDEFPFHCFRIDFDVLYNIYTSTC